MSSLCAIVYWAIFFTVSNFSYCALLKRVSSTVVTERDSLNVERRMTDRRSGDKSLHELEFNNLNIQLYLKLTNGAASEHLDFDFMVLL